MWIVSNPAGRAALKAGLVSAGLLFGVLPNEARAQHVVTEAEASKLTLEALTAEPVYHPSYRAYTHQVMATRWVRRDSRARGAVVRASVERVQHARVRHHRR